MVLLAGLSHLLDIDVGAFFKLILDDSPRFQSCVSTSFCCVQISISTVQIPVSNLDIGHRVLQLSLKVGQFLIGSNSRDYDWHTIDERPSASQQRLPNFGFEVGLVEAVGSLVDVHVV